MAELAHIAFLAVAEGEGPLKQKRSGTKLIDWEEKGRQAEG
jgi:hypothetical protein